MVVTSAETRSKKTIEIIDVKDLILDYENYRISPEDKKTSQEDLLRLLEDDFDLVPIGKSMVDNGFFPVEPLIGIPTENGKIIIVEGNRRLATLKMLTDPTMRRFSRNPEAWEKMAETAKKNGHVLTEAPVVIYENREQLTAILGFRHITGTKKWGPLAKARWVNDIIATKKIETDFSSIAREVGSRSDTIRNNYTAFRTFVQAKEEYEIDTENLEENFGVFYTALNNLNIRDFIGLKREKSIGRLKSPIPKSRKDELRELIEFVHGTKRNLAVISDSRQLKKLGNILVSKPGLAALRKTGSLELADRASGGEERTLLSNLETASFHLDEALKSAHRHGETPKVVTWIKKCEGSVIQLVLAISTKTRGLVERK